MSRSTSRVAPSPLWRLGLGLALTAVVLWSLLPVGLAVVLQPLDVYTVVWFRFLLSFGLLGAILGWRGQLPTRQALGKASGASIVGASLTLGLNYLGFISGLDKTSPANAEVIIQLAPVLLMLGGVVIFRERFSRGQAAGLVGLVVGMLLFFNEQVQQWQDAGREYVWGCVLIAGAAIAWTIYALLQKQLLRALTFSQILLLLFGGCALLLWPLARPSQLLILTGIEWAMLIFCGLNTLVAYSAFAAAIDCWEASRVSAILTLTPLTTIAAMGVVNRGFPGLVTAERLTGLSLVGAGLVVTGSLAIALGQRVKAAGLDP